MNQKEPENILKTADRLTAKDRHEYYGHPLDNFTHTAALINAYFGTEFKPEDVAIIMVMVKLSRQKNVHHLDNLVDICGYIRTIQMCDEKRWEKHVEKYRAFDSDGNEVLVERVP